MEITTSNQPIISNHGSMNKSSICEPSHIWIILLFSLIPLMQVIINVIVITAALQNRKKLRHNYVYIYVINTLTANAIFGLFSFYHMINEVLFIERIWDSTSPYSFNKSSYFIEGLKRWYSFRTGFAVSLFLVMSGSISALIYGIRESSFFVGPSVSHVQEQKGVRRHSQRLTRVVTLITIIWLFPTTLAIFTSTGWSCVDLCLCVSGYYGSDVYPCQTDVHRYCSRLFHPLTNNFLLVTVVTWSLQTVCIIIMIVTTIRKYLNIVMPSSAVTISVASVTTSSNRGADNGTFNVCYSNWNDVTTISKQSREEIEEVDDVKVSTVSCFSSFNYTIKLLLAISLSFVLCTAPSVILIFIDIHTQMYVLDYYVIVSSFLLTLSYSIASPIVMVYYMPGLRSALRASLFKCKCLTRTVTVNHVITAH